MKPENYYSQSEIEENKDDPEEQLKRRLLNAFSDSTIPVDDFMQFTLEDILLESKDLAAVGIQDVQMLRGWPSFRQSILQRDSFMCQTCGSVKDLQVHHALPVSIFPEHIYETKNCITLCKDCHLRKHRFIRDEKEEKELTDDGAL